MGSVGISFRWVKISPPYTTLSENWTGAEQMAGRHPDVITNTAMNRRIWRCAPKHQQSKTVLFIKSSLIATLSPALNSEVEYCLLVYLPLVREYNLRRIKLAATNEFGWFVVRKTRWMMLIMYNHCLSWDGTPVVFRSFIDGGSWRNLLPLTSIWKYTLDLLPPC